MEPVSFLVTSIVVKALAAKVVAAHAAQVVAIEIAKDAPFIGHSAVICGEVGSALGGVYATVELQAKYRQQVIDRVKRQLTEVRTSSSRTTSLLERSQLARLEAQLSERLLHLGVTECV